MSRERTAHLREKAFKAISSCAGTGDQRVILRVLKSIRSVLHVGMRFELGKISRKDILQWQPDQLTAIAAIEHIIKQTKDPLVHHQCLAVLRGRSASEHSKAVGLEANRVAGLIGESFEIRLVDVLARSDDYSWTKRHADASVAHKLHEEEQQKIHREMSRKFQAKYPSPKNGLQVLDRFISQLRAADISLYETPFLQRFSEFNAYYTKTLCKAVAARKSSELSRVFHFLLNALEQSQTHSALPYARNAVATGNQSLCWCVVSYLDWMARQRVLSKDELTLLGRLLKHSEVSVVCHALSAMQWIGHKKPRDGISLLLGVKWAHNTQLTIAALRCIHGKYGISPEKISDRDLTLILKRLERTPSIEDWQISEFLGHASVRNPLGVVKLLVNRIKRNAKKKFNHDQQPIPYEFHHPLPDLSTHPRGVEILSRIRDMTLKRPWPYSHFGRDLFWLLGSFDFCLQILSEWIESNDESRFKGALALLSEIESDFIFSRPGYVESVLIVAQKHGAERLKEAKSCFFFCAIRHGESRVVGQPGPTTVATKDRAAELMKKYPAGSLMATFYQAIVKQSEARLAGEKLRDDELLDGE
ncbi:MAG: hypothetical protein WDN00_03320 [Limisphaerales bacterium]